MIGGVARAANKKPSKDATSSLDGLIPIISFLAEVATSFYYSTYASRRVTFNQKKEKRGVNMPHTIIDGNPPAAKKHHLCFNWY